jgi:hypothetical protein
MVDSCPQQKADPGHAALHAEKRSRTPVQRAIRLLVLSRGMQREQGKEGPMSSSGGAKALRYSNPFLFMSMMAALGAGTQ